MDWVNVWGVELTPERAALIRSWRVEDEDLTWRGTAARASAHFGLDHGSNQIFGRALCRAAATLLGEDPTEKPWA